ncbi:MAG: hypothetical protein FH749_03815 [Firmicutes bacterium]|nr:hypothetical protein [Bacillota bacterium]
MARSKKPSRDDISLMVAVAQLCYQKGKTQEEIAEMLEISRPKVSRLLSQARENGIVEITVRNPIAQNTVIQQKLKQAFALQDAIVTPMAVDQQEVIVPQIARAAAEYIGENLPEQAILGMGRGHSIYEMANKLPADQTLQPTVIPLSGGLGEGDAGYPITEILTRTATALGGKSKYLYAPALVSGKQIRESVLAEPHSQEVVQLWDKMDWAVLGIGAIPTLRRLEDPDFYRGLQAFVQEVKEKPVADFCLWFVLQNGLIPTTSNQNGLIAATPEQISRARVRMAVAGGIGKARAIYAVLKTGLLNVLVTEERTAEEILRLKSEDDK